MSFELVQKRELSTSLRQVKTFRFRQTFNDGLWGFFGELSLLEIIVYTNSFSLFWWGLLLLYYLQLFL